MKTLPTTNAAINRMIWRITNDATELASSIVF